MDDCCCYTDTMVATRQITNHADRVVDEAREAARDALAQLAATELYRYGQPRQTPEYWVVHLQYLLGYLLIALEQAGR